MGDLIWLINKTSTLALAALVQSDLLLSGHVLLLYKKDGL